jgi:hypothetical protein
MKVMSGATVEEVTSSAMPDSPIHNIHEVRLGTPKPVMAEVRQRLTELENELTAELREKRRVLKEEYAAEMAVYKEGDKSVEELTAEGKSREDIIHARSAAQVAMEMAQVKEREIDLVEDELSRLKSTFQTKRDRVTTSLSQIEVGVRAWLLDYVSGNPTNRLHPERPVRAYKQMLQRERFVTEALQDNDLAARAIKELATLVCPDNIYETLFAVMPPRYHKEYEDDRPAAVMERLNNAITGDKQ